MTKQRSIQAIFATAVLPLLPLLVSCSTGIAANGVVEPVVDATGTSVPASAGATATTPETHYVLQPGDVLLISAWKEPDLHGEIVIRPDGGLSFPLAGDL